MVIHNILYLLVAFYAQLLIQHQIVHCTALDKLGNLNDVKILPKKHIIDVTQDKALLNVIHIGHNIPIDGTINIVQTRTSRSRVSIALNAARGCKVKVEINEANDCNLEINLNRPLNSSVDVIMNKAKNSILTLR